MAGVGVGVVKLDLFKVLVHHPAGLIALLAAGAISSLLRGRLVAVAVTAAPIVALAIAPSSVLVEVGIGVGALVLLLTLFAAIGTLLHLCDDRE